MLAVALVVALVAVAGLVFANKKRLEADARSRDALANELVADGLNKLTNAGAGPRRCRYAVDPRRPYLSVE